jgi:hypothetical protein
MEIFREGIFVVEAVALYLIDIKSDEDITPESNAIELTADSGVQ